MEEKAIKFAALSLVVLAIFVCVFMPYLPTLHLIEQEEREARQAEEENALSQMQMKKLSLNGRNSADAKKGQLSLRLPEGVEGARVEVVNDYVTQTIRVTVPETDRAYFENHPISGSSSYIDTISYAWGKDNRGVIEIVTDRVYEIDTTYDENYYYFNFLTPQEIYDKVVVIDAGHGGRAPGATKQGVDEKNIDLQIVLQLKEIFDASDENIGVYYTRTDDSNPTFEQRVQLANKAEADLFISIHNNSTRSGRMSSISGTQVMYAESSEASKKFAQICLEEVTEALGSKDKGIVEGESIYIIRNSEVPAALIEVGFMTNQEELNLLRTEEYQRAAAEGIYAAIRRAFEEGY